ncbi:MAG: alpha/beta hydrolase [Magnetococcales bacterium]|nr:alpha/beta hydrolase [Magnetococcales bacterium]
MTTPFKQKIFAFLRAGVILLLLGYVGAAGYLYLYQDQKVYRPNVQMQATPTQWGLVYEDISLTSEGYRLQGWWLPGTAGGPVVLFLHGNASNISQLEKISLLFQRVGWSTLLFDYRGYGKSAGQPSEAGTYADGQAAWDYLTGFRGIPAHKIILYGHSLGGGVATWLAVRHPPGGVIMEGSFTSVPDRGAEIYPWLPVRWLSHTLYDNRSRIGKIKVPLLVMHSREDEVIPFHHGEQLYALANPPKTFLEMTGRHNEAFRNWDKAEDVLRDFGKLLTDR